MSTHELLDALEAALPSIKNAAVEIGAGDPPEGYEQLPAGSPEVRTADACWHDGMSAMETAVRDWIFDQRQAALKRVEIDPQ